MIARLGRLAPNRVGRGIGRNIMPAFSQPTSREHRREWWRQQLARQKSVNLSVTEFCRQLGISVTTFYYWKKRVDEAPPKTPGQVSAHYPSRHPATAVGSIRTNRGM